MADRSVQKRSGLVELTWKDLSALETATAHPRDGI
jgi:hypothetical protein